MPRLVLLRHGESEWNLRNLFTGWVDVDLSPTGEKEAGEAGRLLASASLAPQVVYTSVLTRAVRTADLALREMGMSWLPVVRHWRLNERHYGGLQGLDKKATAEKYGADQVKRWRRSYDVPPPPLDAGSEMHPANDPRYRGVPRDQLPASECLADVVERFLPYWLDVICADLAAGREVLVVAHGNSLRALIKHLDRIPDADIPALEVPTGVPRVYDLSAADPCSVENARWLGDPEEVAARARQVAQQAGP
jgi:2,3-bisphosphoglycerate-dependent phosphoglycerate mutase